MSDYDAECDMTQVMPVLIMCMSSSTSPTHAPTKLLHKEYLKECFSMKDANIIGLAWYGMYSSHAIYEIDFVCVRMWVCVARGIPSRGLCGLDPKGSLLG